MILGSNTERKSLFNSSANRYIRTYTILDDKTTIIDKITNHLTRDYETIIPGGSIYLTLVPIQNFHIIQDQNYSLIVTAAGNINLYDLNKQKIILDLEYKLNSDEYCQGLFLDFSQKTWICTLDRILVLDKNFEKESNFNLGRVFPSQRFNTITKPLKEMEMMKVNDKKTTLVLFRNNHEWIIIDIAT